MQKRFLLLLITLNFLCSIAVSAKVNALGPSIDRGKWKVTTKLEMPGMPADMPKQTFVHIQCLSGDSYVSHGSQTEGSGGNCEITDIRTSGNTGHGKVAGQGNITYSGDTFKGTVRTVMQGMEMTRHLQGKRIGECD